MTDRFVTVPDSLELPAAVKVPVARLIGPTGAAATPADLGAATAAQGELADTAVQPGDLGNAAGLDVGTTAGTVMAADDARVTSLPSTYMTDRLPRPTTGVPVAVADSVTNNPYWLGRDRKTLYRGGGPTLKTSVDDGATWQTASTFNFSPYIVGVRDLDNGEVIVSTAAAAGVPGSLYLSSGFASVAPTWTKKLDAGAGGVGPSSYFSGNWGMSTCENVIVVSEYGSQAPPTDSARFVYLSQDRGVTWTQIYDIGITASSHIHSAFYDPWWKAIWVSQGDGANRAVKVSFDMGGTWTTVTNPSNVQVVGGIALPGRVLFSTDYQPDGIYRVERTADRTGLTIVSAYHMAGGMTDRRRFVGGMPYWTGRKGDPVLFPFISDETFTASGRLIGTVDGVSFKEVWADSRTYQHKGLWKAVGPTISGAYVGELEDDRGPVRSMLKMSYVAPLPEAGDPEYLTGLPGAGSYTDGDVILVGHFSHAPSGVGTVHVSGGSTNYENVVGGNTANVNTATSNLEGAAELTGQNGNWVFIPTGYDNVVNGWACVVNGFHQKVATDASHGTISGGSLHVIDTGVDYGTIAGGTGNHLTGDNATISGGQGNTAFTQANIAGGLNNNATGNSATIGGGLTNTASNQSATVAGGFSGVASGNSSTVGGGQANTASGQGATVPGGRENVAATPYSVALGRQAVTSDNGEMSIGAGVFAVAGDAQANKWVTKRATTDATASDMQCEGGLPPTIPNGTTWAFRALVVARRTDVDGENAAWEVKGLMKRDAGNTAALVGTPTVTQIAANAGNTWTLTIGAYSVGTLRFIVTGEAAKAIRWVANIDGAQVQG